MGPWTIVRTGNAGRRFRDTAELRLGVPRPKPFCAFVGERSMVLDRAGALTNPSRIVTVIGPGQRPLLEPRRRADGRPAEAGLV